jgi:hypothetical protein
MRFLFKFQFQVFNPNSNIYFEVQVPNFTHNPNVNITPTIFITIIYFFTCYLFMGGINDFINISFLLFYFMFLFKIEGQVYVFHMMHHKKISSRYQPFFIYLLVI